MTGDLFEKPAIDKLKKEMAKSKAEGCECPVCGQFVKVYNRSINSTMARQLIKAYREHGREWFHTRDVVLDGSAGAGDFAKLQLWALIEPQEHEKGQDGKRTSGMWRITETGESFIKGRIHRAKHISIYNNEIEGYSEARVYIKDALGNKFDYNKLMGPA